MAGSATLELIVSSEGPHCNADNEKILRVESQTLGRALRMERRCNIPKLKEIFGAGDGNRTHDIQLGKLTFYL